MSENDLEFFLSQRRQESLATKVRENALNALGGNPDAVAKQRQLSQSLNLPQMAVEDYPDEAEKRQQFNSLPLDKINDYPATAKIFSDGGTAKLAIDDMSNLMALEQAVTFRTPKTTLDKIGDAGRAFASGTYAFSAGIYGALDTAAKLQDDLIAKPLANITGIGQARFANQEESLLSQARRGTQAQSDALIEPALQDAGTIVQGIYSGIQSLGANLPALVAGGVTGIPSLALGLMGLSTFGQSSSKGLDAGLSPTRAALYGAGDAAVEVGTEALPVTRLLGDLKVGTPFFKTLMRQATAEVPGELLATTLQNLNEYATLNSDKPFSSYLEQLPADLTQTLIATLTSVGAQTSILTTVNKAVNAVTRREEAKQQTEQSQTYIDTLQTAVQSSKTAQRAPDVLAAHLEEAAPNAKVFLDGNDVRTLFQSLPPEEQQKITVAIPDFMQKMQEAAGSGSDMVLNQSDFAAHILSNPTLDGFKEHARLSAWQLSPKQFSHAPDNEFLINEALRELDTPTLDDAPTLDGITPQKQLQDNFKEMLVQTGESPAVAEDQANIIASQYGAFRSRVNPRLLERVVERNYGQTYIRAATRNDLRRRGDALDLQLDEARRYLKEQQARAAKRGGITDMLGGTFTRREKATPTPVLTWLESQGGVAPDSQIAGDLKQILDKRASRAIKKNGTVRFDAIPAAEFNAAFADYSLIAQEDGNGYVDPQWLLDTLREESFGNYARTVDQQTKEVEAQNIEEFQRHIQEATGIDIADEKDNSKIRAALAEGDTLYQSSLPEKITIDGKERWTVNSNGAPIAQTEEGIKNFWAWFGDSKVVDADGKPLVVYHQTSKPKKESIFKEGFSIDASKARARLSDTQVPNGIFFKPSNNNIKVGATNEEDIAQIETFLSIKNPLILSERTDIQNYFSKKSEEYKNGVYEHTKEMNKWVKEFDATEGDKTLKHVDKMKVLNGLIESWDIYENNIAAKLRSIIDGILREDGNDGVIIKNDEGSLGRKTETLIALAPTQIKSAIGNSGAFDPNDARILNQSTSAADARSLIKKYEKVMLEVGNAALKNRIAEGYNSRNTTVFDFDALQEEANIGYDGASFDDEEIFKKYAEKYNGDNEVDIEIPLTEIGSAFLKKERSYLIDGTSEEDYTARIYIENAEEYLAGENDTAYIQVIPDSDAEEKAREFASNKAGYNDFVLFEKYADNNALAAAFEALLNELNIEYSDAGYYRGLGTSEYFEISTKSGEDPYKIRFADHDRISANHKEPDISVTTDTGGMSHSFEQAVKFIIDNKDNIIFTKPSVLNQSTRGSITFTPDGTNIITLFQGKDKTTVLHEGAHLYVKTLRDIVAEPDAPEVYKKDWETLKAFVEAESDTFTVDQEEKLARAFEAYFDEGKAPSKRLQAAFSRIMAWFKQVYKGMRRAHLDVGLTDEVRQVFDRALATDAEIEQAAQARQGYAVDPVIVEALNEQERVQYQAQIEQELAVAKARLLKQALKQYEAQATEAYKAERLKVYDEQKAIQQNDPVARALHYLQEGKDLTTGEPFENAAKLDRKAVEARFGKEYPKYMPRGTLADKGGIPPQLVAEMFGIDGQDRLLEALRDHPPLKQQLNAMVDAVMTERYGDMLNDGTIEQKAAEEISSNPERIERLLWEHRAFQRRTELPTLTVPLADFKELARDIIGRTKLQDLLPHRYLNSANKAAYTAGKAAGEGKWGEAAEWKRKQILNHLLYREALKKQKFLEDTLDGFKKLNNPDKWFGKNEYDIDFVNAARVLLSRFDLATAQFDVAKWFEMLKQDLPVDESKRTGTTTYERLSLYESLLSVPPQPYKTLKISELEQLKDAVDNVLHLSKENRAAALELDGATVEGLQDEVRVALNAKPMRDKPGMTRFATDKDKVWDGVLSFVAILRRVEHWAEALDKGDFNGAMTKTLVRPIQRAVSVYTAQKREGEQRLAELVLPMAERLQERIDVTAPFNFTFKTRAELLGAMQHIGNKSSLEKLIGGYEWDPVQFQGFLNNMYELGIVTKQDMDFLQGLWDYYETLTPAAWEAHKKMYGYYPPKIMAKEVSTPWGNYRGGYAPALPEKYSNDKGAKVARQSELNELSLQNSIFATPNKGFTIARTNALYPLDLHLTNVLHHHDTVLKLVHIAPTVKMVQKIYSGDVLAALDDVQGGAFTRIINPYLIRTVHQRSNNPPANDSLAAIDKVIGLVSKRLTANILMLRLSPIVQNITGLGPAVDKVGFTHISRATGKVLGNAKQVQEFINARSPMMLERGLLNNRRVEQAIRDVIDPPPLWKKGDRWTANYGWLGFNATQSFVERITWLGEFNKAMEAGEAESVAIERADSAVRVTQGSNAPQDIAEWEAMSVAAKSLFPFQSYFNNLMNYVVTEFQKSKSLPPSLRTKRLLGLYVSTILPVSVVANALATAISGNWPEDEEKDGTLLDDWLTQMLLVPQLKLVASMVPLFGALGNIAIGQYFTSAPYDDRYNPPVFGVGDAVWKGFGDTYKAVVEDGDKSRAVQSATMTAGLITGLPLAAAGKPLGYLADMAEGDSNPENAADILRGLAGGANKNQK
jgi:hypothetical protein